MNDIQETNKVAQMCNIWGNFFIQKSCFPSTKYYLLLTVCCVIITCTGITCTTACG